MLNRDKQNLLGTLGAGMAADALLDQLRERGTLQGGRSARQEGCWISYNRKAVWLEDHAEISKAMREAEDVGATDTAQAWRRIRPKVVLKLTWTEAAAHGASLPQTLRDELDALRRTERRENRSWSEFSDARGGWPWRRRFGSDDEHQMAQAEWDEVYGKHLVALRGVWDRQKSALARALPLTVNDEPADLLELLAQQPSVLAAGTPAASTSVSALQAAALHSPAADPAGPPAPVQDGLFTLPSNDRDVGR